MWESNDKPRRLLGTFSFSTS